MSDKRRDELLNIVKNEFIGPDHPNQPEFVQANGEEIMIGNSPRGRYLAGVLYPKETTDEIADATEGDDSIIFSDEDRMTSEELNINQDKEIDATEKNAETIEELINRSNAYKPSAMSITASLSKCDCVYVEVKAGQYSTQKTTDSKSGKVTTKYFRKPISWANNDQPIPLPMAEENMITIDIPDTYLKLDVTYRYCKEQNTVYTFTLENAKYRGGSIKDDDCYFQVDFCLKAPEGFRPLPEMEKANTTDEDYLSNQLLYRDIKNYAIGHGCATNWEDSPDKVSWIKSEVFPYYDVKPIVPANIEGVSLNMIDYGPSGDFEGMIRELNLLCNKYSEWILQKEKESQSLNEEYSRTDFQSTAKRHIDNCRTCLARMREGIELLKTNGTIRTAFQYMNLAMIMQQLHYNLPLRKWESNSDNELNLENANMSMPDPYDKDTWYGDKSRYGKWRPFQLAFILINLRSMLEKDSDERGIIDLIWFPTGGGKTEAYLGLSAYTIFVRRLMNHDDSGTAILMRYTLRLLTAQQYERASALICACELIRKEHEDLFGHSRITIGLWVGGDTTPNKMAMAVNAYDKLYKGESDENPFVLLKCPWCGAQMGVVQKGNGLRDIKGYSKKIEAHKKKSIIYKCSNQNCYFSDDSSSLPLTVVDEAIYEEPPTLLLGTVDKFAMLPFTPDARHIFGYYDGEQITAPDLIIQDELHLISGPLGSMVGHYETMINELCTQVIEGKRISPKIIASTATISRAKDQCHALYGCEREKVFQFPPAGLSYDDSFFAYEDKKQNGRRYVGVLAPGASSNAEAMIRLFSSLLFAAKDLEVNSEKDRDPYWTNIGYFNSIRELGQARTWIRADIDQYLDTIYKRNGQYKGIETEEYRRKRRYIYRDEELTSRIPGDKVTANLENLGIRYSGQDFHGMRSDDLPIDICLATNMISVGLDVSRLGLMTVAGQPKTTSEYIQATSRVGRDDKDAPGIVFVLYSPGRPRDKSHYEHFRDYHSKLYCNVEPTSITPFSSPVRKRALHAIMIGMMRMENTDSYNEDPPKIADQELLNHIEEVIKERVENIDPDELNETMKQFRDRLDDWEAWNPSVWRPKLYKGEVFTDDVPLIYGAGDQPNEAWAGHGFETPTSMRNVDATCEAKLLPRKYSAYVEEN